LNPTSSTVALDPCPSYTQSIGIGAPVQQTLLLNCAPVGSIQPAGSVTFEMMLALPANLPKGETKLSWHLEVPNGAFAGTGVTIN